jgi:Amt family ammonium transporter
VILITILVLTLFSNFILSDQPAPSELITFDTGDTAWMIVATALVLIMTPGLGFFYGGMVGKKCNKHNASEFYNDNRNRPWVLIGFGLSFLS